MTETTTPYLDLLDVDVEGGTVEAQAELVRGGEVLVLVLFILCV